MGNLQSSAQAAKDDSSEWLAIFKQPGELPALTATFKALSQQGVRRIPWATLEALLALPMCASHRHSPRERSISSPDDRNLPLSPRDAHSLWNPAVNLSTATAGPIAPPGLRVTHTYPITGGWPEQDLSSPLQGTDRPSLSPQPASFQCPDCPLASVCKGLHSRKDDAWQGVAHLQLLGAWLARGLFEGEPKAGVSWHQFLSGVAQACKSLSASARVGVFLDAWSVLEAGKREQLMKESGEQPTVGVGAMDHDGAPRGLTPEGIRRFLTASWAVMAADRQSWTGAPPGGEGDWQTGQLCCCVVGEAEELGPEVEPLVRSAVAYCGAAAGRLPGAVGGPDGQLGSGVDLQPQAGHDVQQQRLRRATQSPGDGRSEGGDRGTEEEGAVFDIDPLARWGAETVPGLCEGLSDYIRNRCTTGGESAGPGTSGKDAAGEAGPSAGEGGLDGDVAAYPLPTGEAGSSRDSGLLFDPGTTSKGQLPRTAHLASSAPAMPRDPPSGIRSDPSPASGTAPTAGSPPRERGLLTPGAAWAMGLALQSTPGKRWGMGALLLDLGCGGGHLTRLAGRPQQLYSSAKDGRGMNRFLTCVRGYEGTTLFIMTARVALEGSAPFSSKLAALVPGGFRNSPDFFGSPACCLFALAPTFAPLPSTGRDKAFVHCYARDVAQRYNIRPAAQGIGFGGSPGRERVWLDDDFARVTFRHHAVDRTYRPGDLFPGQSYGVVQGKVEGIEVWGLGGEQAMQQQAARQEREQRFLEQRRRVDLANFIGGREGWQDHPDRAILEMASRPVV